MKPTLLRLTLVSCLFGVTSLAQAETTLYLNNQEEPTSLNPSQGFNAISWEPLNNLVEGLVRLDEKHVAAPATAESWTVSPDGKKYTFKLRQNAKWSNGDPVTAKDFVYGWTTMLSKDTASPAAFLAYDIAGAKAFNEGKGTEADLGLKAVDDHTLEVTLANPSIAFLNILTNPNFAPVNQKVAEANPKWYAEASSYVGNGPFTLKEWKHAENLVFVKNPNYWDAANVKIDKVEFAMVNDQNTFYQMYKTGELDATPTTLPASIYDKIKDGKDFNNIPQAGGYFYRLNTKIAPFQNQNIRKAFALAVNQEDIANFVVKQGRKPSFGFVAPGFTGPNGKDFREESGDLIKQDKAKAKELLAKGMEEEKYTTLPEVTLTYINNPNDKKVAETLQNMYKEVLGVDVKLQSMESKVFYAKQRGLELQFSRSSFLNDYADPYNSLESFITGSSMNRTGWSNAEYDKLISSAQQATDAQARWDALLKAEKILIDEAPIFPLYFYNQIFLQKENVKGILRHPVGYLDLKNATKD
ncbi:peptide ABC transporter substrate-binding protein [Pelistega sp. MC2]|uniref:peptide ABC transporter substrate-binding protein n=1 Tax=Pelistega sp. MC2 TaxID=1720297 RepID=UPI0008DA857E|nr:peptide ABC transporter substrate-binding protein [Pelistega sp. MC2]